MGFLTYVKIKSAKEARFLFLRNLHLKFAAMPTKGVISIHTIASQAMKLSLQPSSGNAECDGFSGCSARNDFAAERSPRQERVVRFLAVLPGVTGSGRNSAGKKQKC